MPIKKTRRKSKKPYQQHLFLNVAIGLVGIFLLGFIYSFSQKSIHNGVSIEVNFPKKEEPRRLAADVHDLNPIQNIKVEVLNGCGIKGIATKTADFLLLEYQLDIIRSDNADHYNYPNTVILLRNEKIKTIDLLSKSFGVSMNNNTIIKSEPDESLGVDATIILGKDIHAYTKVFDYFSSEN